jgi:hypothetical protein
MPPLMRMETPATENYDDGQDGVKEEQDGSPASLSDDGAGPNQPTDSTVPVQKRRRRVTRACDECRRKKIKCDGKQPCTHCTVYSYGKACHCLSTRSIFELTERQNARMTNPRIVVAIRNPNTSKDSRPACSAPKHCSSV